MLILKTFESDEQKKLLFFCFFLVVEEGLREPFHARDWLETYGQGPCGTLTIALSPCGNFELIETHFLILLRQYLVFSYYNSKVRIIS